MLDRSSGGSSRRRKYHGRRFVTVLAVGVLAALAGTAGVLVFRSRTPIIPIVETERSLDAIQLWQDRQYHQVEETTTVHLARYPMDDVSMTLRGLARFYIAMDLVQPEEVQEKLVESVQDLRRVLLLTAPQLEPQVRYVLGKAYFHRGAFFYDAAIEELHRARMAGIEQLDLLEYLALAYRENGEVAEAIRYFREAVDMAGEDIHRLSLADLLILQGSYGQADALLVAVTDQTADVTLLQHGLLSLGRSYRAQGRNEEALQVFERVFTVNDTSAEARFQMGETHLAMDRGDRARFEWREALRLNPNHIESFQRLQEY